MPIMSFCTDNYIFLGRFKRRYNIQAFSPDDEHNWRPIWSRKSTSVPRDEGELSSPRGKRRRGRPPLTRVRERRGSSKGHNATLDLLEHVFHQPTSPTIKTEVDDTQDTYLYQVGDVCVSSSCQC